MQYFVQARFGKPVTIGRIFVVLLTCLGLALASSCGDDDDGPVVQPTPTPTSTPTPPPLPPPDPPLPPVQASKDEQTGHGKRMSSEAVLYRDGLLMINAFYKNDDWFTALRPRILVVVVDGAGRAVWVSSVMQGQTMCGVLDPSCKSSARERFEERLPEAVGKHARRLDIYQADNANYVDLRDSLINGIKAAGDIAVEVKNQLERLTGGSVMTGTPV